MPDEWTADEQASDARVVSGGIADLIAAVPIARAALMEITPESTIGESFGHVVEADNVVSFLFASALPGYPGWYWTVTVGRADAAAEPTVLEAELMPGEAALLAPNWVPWSERLSEYQAAQEAFAAEIGDEDDEDDEDDPGNIDDALDIHDLHGDDDLDGVDIDSVDVAYDEIIDSDRATEEAAVLVDDSAAMTESDDAEVGDADQTQYEPGDHRPEPPAAVGSDDGRREDEGGDQSE